MTIRLNDLPAAAARPVQWRRLYENLAILHSGDVAKVLDAAYSVGDSIGGLSDERHLRRLLKTTAGQQLAARHRDAPLGLAETLAGFDALDALPAGSVGREFVKFARRHNLDPLKLIESQHRMSRDYAHLDPLRRWLSDRLTVMHDLWHVLAGYDAVSSGEAALMCFSLPQRMHDRALPIFVAMSILSGQISARDALIGIRRGWRAEYLVAQPFEDVMHLPLTEVRAMYRISTPETAHAKPVAKEAFLIPA